MNTPKFNKSYLLILFVLLLFSSCSADNSPAADHTAAEPTIARKWQIEKIVNNNTGDTIETTGKEYLYLVGGEVNTFSAQIATQGLPAAGTWTKGENQILFSYQTPDFETPVDSIAYFMYDGQAGFAYFLNGVEVARQSANEISAKSEHLVFDINNLDQTRLVISNAYYTYHLSFEAVNESASGGFSFYGLLRGLLGMTSIILIAWLFSTNRRAVKWKTVGIGLALQILIAIAILKFPPVQLAFEFVGQLFVQVLDFTKAGTEFLFGGFLDTDTHGFIFAFQVLPTIIFFSALTSLLFYLGIIQKIVFALAWLMTKAMRLSGSESLAVAGNIFLGQTEAPLLIKHYLPKMTPSEILMVMTGGMATMAGGVLAAYISFLGGDDPVQRLMFAKHLLAASVMAAPGAVVVAKILCPQTETIDQAVVIGKDRIGSNVLDAISNGTSDGLKLAANVAAMLLVFIAFIAMFNFIAGQIGQWTNLNDVIYTASGGQYSRLSLQFILGYAFSPIMWLIGVSLPDITLAGRLLGEKIIMTEFIAYLSLAELKEAGAFADPKTIIMATYMLSGFANFASIGIQIGGIGSLAPNQRARLSQFGMRALLGGTLSALISATIVGVILG